jgi:hypothetical protein
MSRPDTDETNDDDIEDGFGDREGDMEEEELDGLLGSLPAGPVRKPNDSARRRVEEYMEMKRAARELADLDSFDFE